MKKQIKKGFTLVELVIVIAVIAILAGVLIGTFASVIKRANDSAKVQQIKNDEIAQKADDIIKKIEEANWFGWEDFEVSLVEKLTKAYKDNTSATIDSEEIKKAINDAVTDAFANMDLKTTDLTAEQVKAIVENALGTVKYEGVTEAQVRAIVKAATSELTASQLTVAQVKAIVNAATTNNLTQDDVARIIGRFDFASASDVDAAVESIKTALTGATSNLATKEQAQQILEAIEAINVNATTDELDDVITAKSLNIRIKGAGLTKANTPYEVFEKISFDVVPTKKTILLSIEDGQLGFFVVNEDQDKIINSCGLTITEIKYYHWTFANEVSPILSTYLKAVPATVEPNGVGLDVGQQTISTIDYTNDGEEAHSVVIRTNGGTLTIDAENDTVKHYGDANVLVIDTIHTSSYHEYGRINYAQIKKGRIVIENNEASIDNLLLIAKEDKSGFEDIILETKSGATLPELDRTDVDISDKGTLVLNVVTPSSNEFVYLTKAGVIEQVVVTNEKVAESANVEEAASAKSASETSESTFAVAEQVANVGKKNNDGKYVDSNNVVVEIADLTSVDKIVTEAKADNEAVEQGTTYFAGGVGTANNPYVIANIPQWNNLATDSKGDKEFAMAGKYFVVVSDLTLGSDFKTVGNFYGHIDFKNHYITCTDEMPENDWIDYANDDTSIENLNVYNYRNGFSIFYANMSNVSFKNINVYGNHSVTDNNSGLFVMYPGLYQTRDIHVSLENCDVYSTITATSTFSGVYIGTFNSYGATDSTSYLFMKDCTFYGTLTASNYAAMIVSNPSSYSTSSVPFSGMANIKMYLDNVRNEGIIKAVNGAGLVMSAAGKSGYYEYTETAAGVRGTVSFYSDGSYDDQYLIVDSNNERVKLDKDKTPSLIDVKNSGNGATTIAEYAKLVVDENKKLQFYNVVSNNAVRYVVSFGFLGVWGDFHGATFAYNIEIDAADIESAEIYAYQWVNANTYEDPKALPAPGLETHDVVYGNITLKVDSENRYVFSEPNGVIRTQPRITVFAFDNNGNVVNIGTEDGTVIIQSNQPIFDVELIWNSNMPNPGHKNVGEPWDGFYPGADGFAFTTKPVSCDTTRQYSLTVAESYNPASYNDLQDFRLAVVFFNSETGLITEVIDRGYFNTGNNHVSAGETWVFEPTSSASDRFYIVGHCGNPNHHDANATLHAVCKDRFVNNITLVSEKKTQE